MAEENTNTNTTQNAQNDTQATQTTQTNVNVANNDNVNQGTQNDSQNGSQNNAAHVDIEKLIQQAVDRATNKLGNDNKKLREQLETVKKENLSTEQLKELELKNKEADIADREAKIKEKENRLFTIKAIKDVGLDDGSSNALELVDFVMTDNEETTIARVKAFDALVKKFVSAEVSRTFKDKGRNPETGNGGNADAKNNVAVNLGKVTAERNAASDKVLNHYLGGK